MPQGNVADPVLGIDTDLNPTFGLDPDLNLCIVRNPDLNWNLIGIRITFYE